MLPAVVVQTKSLHSRPWGNSTSSNLKPGQINRYKGEILAHAVPVEVLGRSQDTYLARRWRPYGT